MTPPKFVFYLTCLFLGKLAKTEHFNQPAMMLQERHFISADIGGSLRLKCFDNSNAMKVFWYKQRLGQKPQLICSTYKYGKNSSFYNEFHNDPRFTVRFPGGENILKISQLQVSDTGTYFCARSISFLYEFDEGFVVSVKGSDLNVKALVQRTRAETTQSEGFDTLSCTVETGNCDGEHSVYWFRNSEELFYTHETNNSHCERKPSAQTLTCVYNLPIKNFSPPHAGIYYCAVASCGHILFGNGTMKDFQSEVESPGLVYFLSGALTVAIVTNATFTVLLYKMIKRRRCHTQECQARLSPPLVTDTETFQEARSLHYAALNINPSIKSTRQTDTSSDCVYSRVQK